MRLVTWSERNDIRAAIGAGRTPVVTCSKNKHGMYDLVCMVSVGGKIFCLSDCGWVEHDEDANPICFAVCAEEPELRSGGHHEAKDGTGVPESEVFQDYNKPEPPMTRRGRPPGSKNKSTKASGRGSRGPKAGRAA